MSHEASNSTPSIVKGRIGIVGLGLIGGSFARAFAAHGNKAYAWNRTHSITEFALIDTLAGELDDERIGSCELIILATYPEASITWLKDKANLISKDALVIDTIGVKRCICDEANRLAQSYGFTFIGCHPMAGTQYSGFAHATATMFVGAPLVVVPPELEDIKRADALFRLQELLEPCGFASITISTAEEHDRMIAYTSQLAHVVSNAYVKSPAAQAHKGFSAGSYKDLTRVARLNAGMWSELFLDNADFLSNEIQGLIDELKRYKDALDSNDRTTLIALLEEGDRLKREAEEQ